MKKGILALLWLSCQLIWGAAGTPMELLFPVGSAAISGTTQGVAMTDRYIVVGSPQALGSAGEVHVFSATTGKHLRRLRLAGSSQLGARVAISGTRAFATSGATSVHAFDVATGKWLWSRNMIDVANNGGGSAQMKSLDIDSLAADGDTVLVGMMSAWWIEDPNFGLHMGQGAVSGFQAVTGEALPFRLAGDGQASASLGSSVAVAGEFRIAGESFRDVGNLEDCGRTLLFTPNGSLLPIPINPPSPAANDRFGAAVAVAGNRFLISSPGADYAGKTNLGRVHVYDRATTALVTTLDAPAYYPSQSYFGSTLAGCGAWVIIGGRGVAVLHDTASGTSFPLNPGQNVTTGYGSAVAVCSHAAVVVDSSAAGGTSISGRVHLFRQQSRALPWMIAAETQQPAPGTQVGTLFASFGETALSEGGKMMHTGRIKLGGASSANNAGVWSDLGGSLDLLMRKGDTVGSERVGALAKPFFSPVGTSGFFLARSTTLSRQHVLVDNGTSLVRLFGEGDSVVVDGTVESLARFHDLVGCDHGGSLLAASFSARTGVNGVTAKNDSRIGRRGLFAFNADAREGEASPVVDYVFGQLGPRVSAFADHLCFSAGLVGAASGQGGLFTKNLSSGVVSAPATLGAFASGAGLAKFSSITSFQMHKFQVVYKAHLKGGSQGVSSGLWRNTGLVALRGAQAPWTQGGVKYSRFLDYYNAGDNVIVFRARLSGPGINTRNDVGIWVHGPTGVRLLLREGDSIPNTQGQRVGVIQRLDVHTDGRYAILASIAGAEAARNQALLVGRLTSTEPAYAAPSVLLHKGVGIELSGHPMALQSLLLSGNHVDASGAGSKGAAGQVRGGRVLLGMKVAGQSQLRVAPF